MPRLFIYLSIVFVVLGAACSKSDGGSENLFFGTWVKGTHAGDTLMFTRKNGKTILKYNQSFNPGLPIYTENEYSYQNNKLAVALYGGSKKEITSFAWIQRGATFEILGYELFPFMSSTLTRFTYTKIN